MIIIDIPMPTTCEDCPCSYCLRSGPDEGAMICNIKDLQHKENIFVKIDRPKDCPIIEVKTRRSI